MLVHHRVTNSVKFNATHLYTWVERGTVRVKRLAQEHNTMATWPEKLKSFELTSFFFSFILLTSRSLEKEVIHGIIGEH